MKINLLYKDIDEVEGSLNVYQKNLIRDLKLELVLEAMSGEESGLYKICESVLMRPLNKEEEILRRQEVMKDAISFPYFFKAFFKEAKSAIAETKAYRKFTEPKYYQIVPPSKKIITEAEITKIFIKSLEKIINLFDEPSLDLKSQALKVFKNEMKKNFNENYFKELKAYIQEISSVKESAEITIESSLKLGLNHEKALLNHIGELGKVIEKNKYKFLNRIFNNEMKAEEDGIKEKVIVLDNTVLANNKQELVEASLNAVFRLLGQFNRSLLGFFEKIYFQFGFFYGGTNLYTRLKQQNVNLCMPQFMKEENIFKVEELIDIGLAIKIKNKPVANAMTIRNKKLWLITGANQGGKTTFLRSVGIATLMAECGLFVGAKSYMTNIYEGIYTHFPDAEDDHLGSGLLDQELNKLNEIIKVIRPKSLLLMNESFATTTEKEASYIAEEVIKGLKEKEIKIIFVTHLYEYAHKLYESEASDIIFYRAMRRNDGTRSYELEEGEPLKTSYGMDLYESLIGH